MARSIYEKPTRELMKDMLDDWGLKPGQVFTSSRAIEWFKQKYPKLKLGSVRGHLLRASTNDRGRLHHQGISETDDLLVKVAPGQYRLYESGKDPAPIREFMDGDVARAEGLAAAEEDAEEKLDADPLPGSSEFLLEKDLQRYLAENLTCMEPGLRLYEYDGVRGIEFEAGDGRRIDILAVDRNGGLVVLELKVSRGFERVIGQILRYMNWVRKEVAEPGQRVRGMIVCRTISEDLRLACASIGNVDLFEYKLSVSVAKVPAIDLPG
jgi:hypothetical protein